MVVEGYVKILVCENILTPHGDGVRVAKHGPCTAPLPANQVIEALPIGCSISERIYFFEVPVATGLGTDDKSFGKVTVRVCNSQGSFLEEKPRAEFFPDGKLGGLKGGLLDLQVVRKVLTQSDIKALSEQTTEQSLETNRTSF